MILMNAHRANVTHPNIVLVLTDDQDYLGGRDALRRVLPRSLEAIADNGVLANNWLVHTPVCCPSRSELLTGRFFHNLRMANGTGSGCMHVQTGVPGLEDKVNSHSFAKHLVRERGYTAGWLGKHLNTCPHDPPPGYDCPTCRWFVNNGAQDTEPGGYLEAPFADFIGNVPVNDTYSANGSYAAWRPGAPVVDGMRQPQHGGYVTAIIANKSIEWLRTVAGRPFVLTLAPKAPHYPATPAPWYETGTWIDAEQPRAPRTAAFGVAPWRLGGHHSMIASQGPLLAHERRAIDRQFRKRSKALLSVDDAVDAVTTALGELGVAGSTYLFVTSDHGYNLGQHNLPSCKLNAYDHAVRVPMLIRGPGIAAGLPFAELGSHVDLAPTFLALAGLEPTKVAGPPLDGKSLLPWLLAAADPEHLPRATREQLRREEVHLFGEAAALNVASSAASSAASSTVLGAASSAATGAAHGSVAAQGRARALPPLRAFHWIEFYSLGNLTVCGGGSRNGSVAHGLGARPQSARMRFSAGAARVAGESAAAEYSLDAAEDDIRGSTCQADIADPYGYCHMPCPHTATGATPLNLTCDLTFCVNVTCCGAEHTQFSSLEGMRCGAGHSPGSLPFDSSADPGHQVDCDQSNTYRALRFVDRAPGGRGNKLYAEFTRLSDFDFSAADVFVEVFDLDADPGQLVNLANATSKKDLEYYRSATRTQFECAGASCV